jgi:putative transposase
VAPARVGSGHVYQGRYKSLPVETEDYLYQVVRYVERNALRANLVDRGEDWRRGSLWHRTRGGREKTSWLSDRPEPMPSDWPALVNQPRTNAEVEAIRRSVARSQLYGGDAWVRRTAQDLGLESTLHARGHPRAKE